MSDLKSVVNDGVSTLSAIADLREHLKELITTTSDEVGVEKKTLRKLINTAYKNDIDTVKAEISEIEDLLAQIK